MRSFENSSLEGAMVDSRAGVDERLQEMGTLIGVWFRSRGAGRYGEVGGL